MEEGHYHLHAEPLQRSKGHSSLAAAAYRAGVKLHDERTGETHDYRRRGGVLQAELILPEGAPAWAHDRETFWNRAEAMERRKDAQTARMLDIAIPHELSDDDRIELVRAFVKDNFVRFGMGADVAWHAPHAHGDARNVHAHVMLTLRKVGPDGFDPVKTRRWNSPEMLKQWRAQWAVYANGYLERAGFATRIDHRSYKDRGVDRTPTIKEGRKRRAMAAKGLEPAAPTRDFTADEMRFVRAYFIADEAKRRWMRDPRTKWAKERRAVLYKTKQHGDRLWENFHRAKGNYARVLDEHERLRGDVALAKQELGSLRWGQRRAMAGVHAVFQTAYVDAAAAKAKFAEMARRKGVLEATEEALKRPQALGRMKGQGLFGGNAAERREGARMLGFLKHRVMAASTAETQTRSAENWLVALQNHLEKQTGRERIAYQDWGWTVARYRAVDDNARQWRRLQEEKSLLRMEQEREIKRLQAEEELRVQKLEADGRYSEAQARRYNQSLHSIFRPPADGVEKQLRKDAARARLQDARRMDRADQAWRRGREREDNVGRNQGDDGRDLGGDAEA